MTAQEALDQAAISRGYESYEDLIEYHAEEFLPDGMTEFINRALEIYGQAQWNAAIEKAAESVEVCPNCGGYGYTIELEQVCCGNYKEYGCCGVATCEQVQVECNCDKGYEKNEDIKQSILKLKK